MKFIRKRRRKIDLFGVAFIFFQLAVIFNIFSNIFIRTDLVAMNIQSQKIEREIESIRIKNEALSIEISNKTSYDSLKPLIDELGLSSNFNNMVVIRKGGGE